MIVPARFVEAAAVATSPATLYTAPANQAALIKKFTIANTTTDAIKVSVYLIPAGETAGNGNALRKEKTLAPHETFECFEAENHLLAPGDMLAAAADAGGLVCQASGLLIT